MPRIMVSTVFLNITFPKLCMYSKVIQHLKEINTFHTIIVYLLFNSLISHIYSPKPNEGYVLSGKLKYSRKLYKCFLYNKQCPVLQEILVTLIYKTCYKLLPRMISKNKNSRNGYFYYRFSHDTQFEWFTTTHSTFNTQQPHVVILQMTSFIFLE